MKNFENNDLLVLNSVIYKIYSVKDLTQMRNIFLEQLKLLLDFDSASFFLVDSDNNLQKPIVYNIDDDTLNSIEIPDYSKSIVHSGKCIVYRETDIISDEQRILSDNYKNIYLKNRWHYGIELVLAYNKEFLGLITLYRSIGKDNFKYDEIFLLDMLKEHLSFRLYEDKKKIVGASDKLSIKSASEKFGLTKRETGVLRELLAGKNNDEICSQLIISTNTLKKHILNIYRKLGINNRVQMFKLIQEE